MDQLSSPAEAVASRPTALIIVDVQQGFNDAAWWGPRDNPACEANIAALLDEWRRTGRPVVFVKHASTNPASPLHPGNPGHDFKPIISGRPDLLVTKTVNSSFLGTPDLHAWLTAQKIGAVVVCGITTNHCCETTARMGGNLGYEVYFPTDATHTFDRTGIDGQTVAAADLARITGVNLHGEFATVVRTADLLGTAPRPGQPAQLGRVAPGARVDPDISTFGDLPRAEFGFPGPLRDRLVDAVLSGSKTTTTSTVAEYGIEDDPLPRVGARQLLVNSSNEPVAVIETVRVEQVPLGKVPWEHVRDEGEGHSSIEEWRAAHEEFWHSAEMRGFLGDPGFTVSDETLVVLERFRLVQMTSKALRPHLTLRPMPAERLAPWIDTSMSTYIEERMKAGESLSEAGENAERSFAMYFPNGSPAPLHQVFDLMLGGSPVGYLWIGPTESDATAWWIYDIAVEESFRHQGLGREAMLLAEQEAQRLGASSLGLNVFGHNKNAQRLYEKLGYAATATQMKKLLPAGELSAASSDVDPG